MMAKRHWNTTVYPWHTVGQGGVPVTQHKTWRAARQYITRSHNEPYLTIAFRHPTQSQEEYESQHPAMQHR